MIENIADKIMNKMLQEKLIDLDEKEIYTYVFISRTEQLITFILLLLIAIMYRVTFQTVLFLIFFLNIRKRTGGYHAKRFFQCCIGTISVFLLFTAFIYPVMLHNMKITYLILVVSVIVLEVLGAVNPANMNWNTMEYQMSRQLARETVLLEAVIVFFLSLLCIKDSYIVFMVYGIFLSAFLLLIGKIQNR